MDDQAINLQAGGLTLPPDVQRAGLHIIDDIVPPRWPEGVVLVLQRPGELGVVATIPIPPGCMLALVPPEAAAQMRPAIEAMRKQHAEAMAKLAQQARNGVG